MSIFNGFPWIPVFPQHRIPSGASSGMLLHPHGPRKVDHPSLGSTGKKKKIFHIVDFKFHSCPSPIFVSDVMPLDHVGPTLSSLIDQGIFKKKKKKVIKSHDYCRFGGGGSAMYPHEEWSTFFLLQPLRNKVNQESWLGTACSFLHEYKYKKVHCAKLYKRGVDHFF